MAGALAWSAAAHAQQPESEEAPAGADADEGTDAAAEDAAARETADGRTAAELEARVAELESLVGELSEQAEEDELARLVAEAEAEADAPPEETAPEERTFLWGALALQKLNPEISVSADFLAGLIIDDDAEFYAGADDRSTMVIREVGFQIQHVLDPFSMFKAAVNFFPEPDPGVEVEEIYMTWFGLVPSLSLSVGRFRQDLGVVNRWHGHDLDQTDYPLAMSAVLGDGGVAGTGLSMKWFMPPLWASANQLTIQVATGESDALFAGEFVSVPTVLGHLKNYWDLSEATYLELGLSGMWGVNNRRGYVDGGSLVDEPWRHTGVAAADLTLNWSPPARARYRSVTWRSEGYYVRKQTPQDPTAIADGTGVADGVRQALGAYSYLDVQLAERWFAGVRGDVALPLVRTTNDLAWDVVPYLTFWQSEFVYLRLEYRHGQEIPFEPPGGGVARRTDNRVLLQIDWAAGPHKHEKY